MSQPLPTGGFKWIPVGDSVELLERYTDDGEKGLILEVDLEYPQRTP